MPKINFRLGNKKNPKIDPQKYCLNICASGKFNSDNNFSLKRLHFLFSLFFQ